jgi:hypothetical protein
VPVAFVTTPTLTLANMFAEIIALGSEMREAETTKLPSSGAPNS